jgi:hypothetical protein
MAKRYIDAEELELEYYGLSIHGTIAVKSVLPIFADLLEKQPTADVVEVRHGRWIDRYGKTWCSLCKASNKQYKPPYCPHCGARMDGDEE